MSGNNNSYGPWKPALPMDIIPSGNYSKPKRDELHAEPSYCATSAPVSSAAVFAAAAAAAAANMHFAMPSGIVRSGELMPGVLPLLNPAMGHPSMVPSHHQSVMETAGGAAMHDNGAQPPIDIYTSIGIQELGKLYKTSAVPNNHNNNKGLTTSNELANDGNGMDQVRKNIQHLVESAIRYDSGIFLSYSSK